MDTLITNSSRCFSTSILHRARHDSLLFYFNINAPKKRYLHLVKLISTLMGSIIWANKPGKKCDPSDFHQLVGTRPNNIFSTLDNLHVILQLTNKQISSAMPFISLIIINDCSSYHTQKGRNHILEVKWPYSNPPYSLVELCACANMLVDVLIDD